MSVWHDLYKARENSQKIADEISIIIREHNGLTKKEIAMQSEKLAAELQEAQAAIAENYKELNRSLSKHGKALKARSRFLKRHNENGFV